jgi:hypothetical protein
MKQNDNNAEDTITIGDYASFSKIDDKHYFLMSVSITAPNQIIEIGKSYLICDCPTGSYIDVYDAKLLEVFNYEELVILILETEMSRKMFLIDLFDDYDNFYTSWMLLDIDFFLDEIREKKKKETSAKQ